MSGAWTAPRTWAAADVPTAALFNTHIRDNVLTLWRETAVQTEEMVFNQVIALADLPGLALKGLKNERWEFSGSIYAQSTSAADTRFAITAPVASGGRFGFVGSSGSAHSTTFASSLIIPTGALNEVIAFGGVIIFGRPGIMQVQAAQSASTAANTTFFPGSFFVAWRHV